MFSLTNPWVLVGIMGLVISSYFYGHHAAYNEQAIEVARLNAIERDKEAEMVKIAGIHATELKKANDDAKVQISKLQSDIASGELRLSIASRPVQTSEATGATPGAGDQARCELDPETAKRIIAIPSDGDANTRQLNALIDYYNEVRSKQ